MAELTTRERLQPSLLDRLTDDEPQARLESREKRVMSMRQLRAAVLRDLEWLLNARSRPLDDEIHQFPLVAKSVVNFGMPDLTGLAASGIAPGRIEGMVYDAVRAFEPRIVGHSLEVRAGAEGEGNHLVFEISGELCPLPMPEALYVRTDVDLETGRCEIRERNA
jgi:type VI secretion system protein ImpF